jgi:formylglycine-generating enzyme required for sulfatase activity
METIERGAMVEEEDLPQYEKGKNYFLGIGINNYLPPIAKLRNCVNDVQNVHKVLLEKYEFDEDDAMLIFDREATRSNILKTLREMLKRVGKNDGLVLMFSGHGIDLDGNNVGYMIPVDGNEEANYINLSEVKSLLDAAAAKHIFVIFDACFSGLLLTQRDARAQNLPENFPSRYAMTSGRDHPVDDGTGNHSPFAKVLIDELRFNDESLGSVMLAQRILDKFRMTGSDDDQLPAFGRISSNIEFEGQYYFYPKNFQNSLARERTKRLEAEQARRLAQEALVLAEQERQKAEEQTKIAIEMKEKSEKNQQKAQRNARVAICVSVAALVGLAVATWALFKIKAANKTIVQSMLRDIDNHILKMEYDLAAEKSVAALPLNVEEEEVAKRLLEVAFWYSETDSAAAAVQILNYLNVKVAPNQADILLAIKEKSPPQYFSTLEARYFPTLVSVKADSFIYEQLPEVDISNNRFKTPLPNPTAFVNAFKIATTETTVWQYFLYLNANKYEGPPLATYQYLGNQPVVNVSWQDATDYLNWLSQKKGFQTVYDRDISPLRDSANGFRLPYQKEWTFALLGGNHHTPLQYDIEIEAFAEGGAPPFPVPIPVSELNKETEAVAWLANNSKNSVHGVGLKKANALGLYDMIGNVEEWCNDYKSLIRRREDGGYSLLPDQREAEIIVCGNSWQSNRDVLKSKKADPDERKIERGFRVAQNGTPQ